MTMTIAFITGALMGSAVTLLIMSAMIVAKRADEQHESFSRGYDVGYVHGIQDNNEQS